MEQLRVDYLFGLVIGSDYALNIGGVALLTGGLEDPGSLVIDPGAHNVAAGLRLLHDDVADAVAFKTGVLRVRFVSGRELWVSPDDTFEAWETEAWETAGRGTAKVVCMPGGKLAVWA